MRSVGGAIAWAAVLVGGIPAAADTLPAQGEPCTATKGCAAKLRCVTRKAHAATCERTCAANADCPADQRCVKDLGLMLCRAITDDDMSAKRPSF